MSFYFASLALTISLILLSEHMYLKWIGTKHKTITEEEYNRIIIITYGYRFVKYSLYAIVVSLFVLLLGQSIR